MKNDNIEREFSEGIRLQYEGAEHVPDNSYSISKFCVEVNTGQFRGSTEFEMASFHTNNFTAQLTNFSNSFFALNAIDTIASNPVPELKCGYGDDASILMRFHKTGFAGQVLLECTIKDDFNTSNSQDTLGCNSLHARFFLELQQVKEFVIFMHEIYKYDPPLSFVIR